MKKGFTLIELLAVILILGIIALIAIPQVTNVIEDSKKGAVEVSGENYIKALQDRVSLEKLKDGAVLEGVKTVSEINTAYPNLVSGNALTTGTVIIANGKVIDATFEDSKYTATCTNGKCEVVDYVYFQSEGIFTSLDQTVTTRPTTYKAYLKIDKNDISKKQSCTYDNGKEMCLKPNEYEITRPKVLNYFEYATDGTWTQDGEIWTKGNKVCNINDSFAYAYCRDSSVAFGAYSDGIVPVSDMVEEFVCLVANNGTATCGFNENM